MHKKMLCHLDVVNSKCHFTMRHDLLIASSLIPPLTRLLEGAPVGSSEEMPFPNPRRHCPKLGPLEVFASIS